MMTIAMEMAMATTVMMPMPMTTTTTMPMKMPTMMAPMATWVAGGRPFSLWGSL
jgi:hypothetical protein